VQELADQVTRVTHGSVANVFVEMHVATVMEDNSSSSSSSVAITVGVAVAPVLVDLLILVFRGSVANVTVEMHVDTITTVQEVAALEAKEVVDHS
jgi:hypothetical protein